MSDVQNIAARATLRALGAREARKNSAVQFAAGLILLVVGYFTATSGYGETVGPANTLCALVVLVGGLLLCVQAMLVVFRALLAQYEHFAMPAEEAAFSLYAFRFAGALMLAGARMLLPWRWAQALCEAALAAILLYCAVSRLKGADWRRFAPAVGGALAALSAAAGLAVLAGVFAGFSWSLSMGIAALGFGLDSLWDALASMQVARG